MFWRQGDLVLLGFAFWRYWVFYKLKVCANPVSNQAFGASFPTALFLLRVSVSHVSNSHVISSFVIIIIIIIIIVIFTRLISDF